MDDTEDAAAQRTAGGSYQHKKRGRRCLIEIAPFRVLDEFSA
jgi:hypothetical protein